MKESLLASRQATVRGPDLAPSGIPTKWIGYYRKLLAARERLSGDQRNLVGEVVGGSPAGMHNADAASDRCDQGLASTLLTSERDVLLEIEEALGRMRAGTYGICELSGRKISAARLRAIPWTRFSAAAEQQLEEQILTKKEDHSRGKAGTKAPHLKL